MKEGINSVVKTQTSSCNFCNHLNHPLLGAEMRYLVKADTVRTLPFFTAFATDHS